MAVAARRPSAALQNSLGFVAHNIHHVEECRPEVHCSPVGAHNTAAGAVGSLDCRLQDHARLGAILFHGTVRDPGDGDGVRRGA